MSSGGFVLSSADPEEAGEVMPCSSQMCDFALVHLVVPALVLSLFCASLLGLYCNFYFPKMLNLKGKA